MISQVINRSMVPFLVWSFDCCLSLQNHRAPSVGFFLYGLSAALNALPSSGTNFASLQRDAELTSEVLAPVLVTFDFLWLSRDHNTAHILLCGSCLLLGLSDRLSGDTFAILTCCLGLSSLSCCLTVCVFASNALGALGGVALSLPLLVTQAETNALVPLIVPVAPEGLLLKWLLKGSISIGVWASTQALNKFLLDMTEQHNLDL